MFLDQLSYHAKIHTHTQHTHRHTHTHTDSDEYSITLHNYNKTIMSFLKLNN